jgi:hypothetical protein
MVFGLLGITSTHYISVNKTIYETWVDHYVFPKEDPVITNFESCDKNRNPINTSMKGTKLCPKNIGLKIETLARESSGINNIYSAVICSLYFTSAIILGVGILDAKIIDSTFNFDKITSANVEQYVNFIECLSAIILTIIILGAAYILTRALKNLYSAGDTADE